MKIRSTSSLRPRGPGLFGGSTVRATQADFHIDSLRTQVRRAIAASQFSKTMSVGTIANDVYANAVRNKPLPLKLAQAFRQCVNTTIDQSITPLYSLTPETPQVPFANFDHRAELRAQHEYLTDETARLSHWQRRIERTFSALAESLPKEQPNHGSLTFDVPLIGLLPDPVSMIDELVRSLSELAFGHDRPKSFPGYSLSKVIINNLLVASRMTVDEALRRPHRLTWPVDAKQAAEDLVSTYLANTPFATFFNTTVKLSIPSKLRCEHAIFTATIGHGKTQMMQSIVLQDLHDPARPGTIIIDSQLDTIAVMSRMELFCHRDDPVFIDPTDPHPPALNLFHLDRQLLATLNVQQREEFLAGAIELFVFICSGMLRAELTPRMSVVFRYLAQLLIKIDRANIHTAIDLLRDPTEFAPYIAQLPRTAQNFIDEVFDERSQYRQTRHHILQRFYHLLSNPAFERMFAHTENKFNMRQAMQEGRTVFISTAKAQLKSEWSAMFGRFWLAIVMQAAFARAFIPLHQRRVTYVHIDEASEVADQTVDQLLISARKYAVGVSMYHQTFDQMQKAGLRATALSIPALRFTGSLNDADARLLAPEMRTTAEFLKDVRKTNTYAEWACHVRNLTPSATKITVPFLAVERQPRMSEQAYQAFLERNRQKVSAPRVVEPQTAPATTPQNNDPETY